jgi:hypothetical protein
MNKKTFMVVGPLRPKRSMTAAWLHQLQYVCNDSRNFFEQHPQETGGLNVPRSFQKFLNEMGSFSSETWGPSSTNGNTLLHEMCKSGFNQHGRETLKLLFGAMIQAGLKVDHQNLVGRTALHSACFNRNLDAGLALLDHQANCMLLDRSGDSALHDACASKCEGLVEELLVRGCDPMQKNKHGKAPWQVAHDRGHKEMSAIMLAYLEVGLLSQVTTSKEGGGPGGGGAVSRRSRHL